MHELFANLTFTEKGDLVKQKRFEAHESWASERQEKMNESQKFLSLILNELTLNQESYLKQLEAGNKKLDEFKKRLLKANFGDNDKK